MNFIVENLKNPKTILIVSGLITVIIFSALLVGYESYLRTLIVPTGEQATLYPDQSIAASYVISDHESWNLGNCCSSSPDISAGDYKNELAVGYYCHHREGEYSRLYRRITLRFDLSSLPDGTSINSAKLYLKPSKISYSQDVNIYGASNDNWEEANCFDPNRMKSCPQSAAAFQPGSLNFQDKVNINNTNWKNWNVTNFVYSKQNSGSKYVTLHLVGSAEDLTVCNCDNCWDKRAVNFWGPRSSSKPYLLINHSGGGTTPTCTDSDGGINVMEKGTTKDNSYSYTDYCVGNSIVEYFCQNGVAKRASDSPSGYSCSTYGQNMICKKGACVEGPTCGAGLTLCGEECVNLNSDVNNCGGCGYKCSSDYKCQNGDCVKEELDPTCEADGKCKLTGCPTGDPDCPCSQHGGVLGGFICQANETCPGTSLKHSGTGTCCSVACIPAAIYSISGQVKCPPEMNCVGLTGLTMNLSGAVSKTTTTIVNGNYSFNDLANGSYVVAPYQAPSDNTWIFSPISQNVTVSNNNASKINFTTTRDLCKQYFKVQDENSTPIAGARIFNQGTFPEISGGPASACNTDNNGNCYIEFLRRGKNHAAKASKSGYECYNNECQQTFDGCLVETIILKLKKPAATVYQTADLNCDGNVNLTDSAILMSFWNKDPSGVVSCQSPDINQDGKVNLVDSAIMMSQWTML